MEKEYMLKNPDNQLNRTETGKKKLQKDIHCKLTLWKPIQACSHRKGEMMQGIEL